MTLESMEKRLADLEQRVKNYEDIEKIRLLHYRYINCVTFAKWDEIMDCFADDCEFIYGRGTERAAGKPAIEKLYKEFFSKGHQGRDYDIVVHPMIVVNGDQATGNWMMFQLFSHIRTGQALFWVQGIFDMKYIRENGEWKISSLTYTTIRCPPGGPPPYEGV